MSRPGYLEAIRRVNVLSALIGFDPHVAGTPPLGLDLPNSDIDILCHITDPQHFAAVLWANFGTMADFGIRPWRGGSSALVAGFVAEGWAFEIFGQTKPVAEQDGWLHFVTEKRLLAIGGENLTAAVMTLRLAGMKTEPAFAAALKLEGDPYQALLDVGMLDDQEIARLIEQKAN